MRLANGARVKGRRAAAGAAAGVRCERRALWRQKTVLGSRAETPMPSLQSSAPRARAAPPRRSPNPFAALAKTVRRGVNARLDSYLDAEIARAAAIAPDVAEMVKALADLCRRGGKRLRPALLVAGFRAVDARADVSVALDAGVALELLQAYFLIHDDWMDGDEVRRGGPSVHALLTRQFKNRKLGEVSAILAGDYAVALATECLAQLELPGQVGARVFGCFARMQRAAVAGQQMDVLARAEDVEQVYALKTGSYSVHGPLELGALLAGAAPGTLRALERFSRPLGIAFQLRDDLLGAFGQAEDTGKPLGSDLVAGKRTLLVQTALSRLKGRDRRALSQVLGNAKARPSELVAALALIELSGARGIVEARVRELADEALQGLGRPMTDEGRALLTGAVEALTQRGS